MSDWRSNMLARVQFAGVDALHWAIEALIGLQDRLLDRLERDGHITWLADELHQIEEAS